MVDVCDVDADRATELAVEHDVSAFEDQEELYARHDPDLASVTTPEAPTSIRP